MNDFDQRMTEVQAELASLPVPETDACEHSARLVSYIHEQIRQAGGVIPFARFMELALYAPGLGYYTAGARKFGVEGDFVTAPEISPLFGQCMANNCVPVLRQTGGSILEFGAGSGALARDVLQELARQDCLPDEYLILEVSPELRQRQAQWLRANVPQFSDRIRWLDTLPEAGFTGVVLANEVLDAMPVHRFHKRALQVEEVCVGWSDEQQGFILDHRPAGDALLAAVSGVERDLGQPFDDGYTSEISLAYTPWLASLGERLESAVALLIDYGYARQEYYLPQRSMGTLMCHYRHRAHDNPLVLPGLQDITAYVDFTAVAEGAVGHGFSIMGYTTQAAFLLASGLDQLVARVDAEEQRAFLQVSQQVKTLTLPGEMGERFKVMGLSLNCDVSLPGFTLQDHRGRL